MKYIIIGCPRNGSTFISEAFKKNGIEVGHEKLETGGISSWTLASNTKHTLYGPSLDEVLSKIGDSDYSISHQIREPLSTISSITTIQDKSWKYVSKFIDLSHTSSVLHRSMLFWYEWNLRCENITSSHYKLHDYKTHFNLKHDHGNTRANSRPHTTYTLENLFEVDRQLCENIVKLSQKYGYELQ